jgi:hypothetical protein
MQINSVNSLSQGLQSTLNQFADAVARQNAPDGDLIQEQVTQTSLLRTAQAQVSAIQAEDEMLGNLFDALA